MLLYLLEADFFFCIFSVLRRMCTLLSIAALSDAKAEASHKQAESASRTAQVTKKHSFS